MEMKCLNLPSLYCLVLESIKLPISGSLMASQIFSTTSSPAKTSESMPMYWVQNMVKYVPAKAKLMLQPKSPAA